MKLTVMQPKEVEAAAIRCSLPIEGEDGIPDYMLRCVENGRLKLTLDIATRRVPEWPLGKPCKLMMMPRDEGIYELLGTNGTLLAAINENYVPSCIPGKYGDYIEFDIGADGTLVNWTPHPARIKESFFPGPGEG